MSVPGDLPGTLPSVRLCLKQPPATNLKKNKDLIAEADKVISELCDV